MPLVFNVNRPPGLSGLIVQAGLPVPGQQLELFRYVLGDPDTAVSQGTATSTDGGRYDFPAAALSGNQAYFVRWVNPSQTYDSRAYAVFSNDITTFNAVQSVQFNTLDIEDIVLVGPSAPPAGVGLPITLQWTPRVATPSDNYRVRFFSSNFSTLLATSPDLGYVGSYTLATLPSGLTTATDYQWDVIANGPGGSLVVPWEALVIRFFSPPLVAVDSSGRADPASLRGPRGGVLRP